MGVFSDIRAAPLASLPDVDRLLNLPGAHMPIRRSGRDEEVANIDAIASLAEETQRPLPIVKEIYDAEFARLKDGARITDYLVLFASRRARDALAQHQS